MGWENLYPPFILKSFEFLIFGAGRKLPDGMEPKDLDMTENCAGNWNCAY